jgi:hypothetical protein
MVLLILLLSTATAFAQVAILDTTGTPPGRYYAQIDIAADGHVTAKLIPDVIRLDGKPTPPPDPKPDVLTARATAIKAAALKVTGDANRDKTALELAALYEEIGKKVTAGEIKGPDTIAAVAKGAADILLSQGNRSAAWQGVRDAISTQWSAVAQEGGKDADYAKLLGEISDGLTASVQQPQAIDIAMIMKIIQLIMGILKLIPQAALSFP